MTRSSLTCLLLLLLLSGTAWAQPAMNEQEEVDLCSLVHAYRAAYAEAGRDGGGFGPWTNIKRTGHSLGQGTGSFADTVVKESYAADGGALLGPSDYARVYGQAFRAWEQGFSRALYQSDTSQKNWGSCIDHQEFTYQVLSQVPQSTWRVLRVGTTAHNWVEIENVRTGQRFTFDAWYWQKPNVVEGSQLASRYRAAYRRNLLDRYDPPGGASAPPAGQGRPPTEPTQLLGVPSGGSAFDYTPPPGP